MNRLRPAIFLDRDGTVNHQVGYVNHPSRLRLYRFTAEAIRRLNEGGIPVVVVTNQSGVARGLFPLEALEESHRRLVALLHRRGARLDGIYYCPHHPTEGLESRSCRCRKPKTGLIRRASRELGLDPARSFMVGDTQADILLGNRVGAKTVLVLTGYGKGEQRYLRERWRVQPDHVARNLLDATGWILERWRP